MRGAIVYLDAGCSESFQIVGAFSLLLELGARCVCSLEKVSPLDQVIDWNLKLDPAKKVVIFTSHLLSDAHRYVLRCLSALQGVRYCTILTSISEMAHSAYPNSPLGPDAYQEYESLLVQDYQELVKRSHVYSGQSLNFDFKEKGNMIEDEGWSQLSPKSDDVPNAGAISSVEKETVHEEDVLKKLVVSVHHFPIILCPFSPRVFVLPSEGSIAEAYISSEHENSISAGLPNLNTGTLDDTEDISPGATLTAQFLYHLAGQMDLKLEIFSLGDISKTVGKLLMDMSSLYDVGRRKRSAGLLLVDRTLDLLTPCCHGDSLIDRLFSCLPRKERTTFPSHVKSSQNHLKGAAYLERESLNVQIPLEKIIEEETPSGGSFQLLEKIEAVLRGWNHKDAASQLADLSDLSIKLAGEMSLEDSKSEILNGSFVSTDNFHGTPYLEALLERKTRDGILLIKKWLQESIRRENIFLNANIRPGFPSKEELLLMVKAIARSKSAIVKNKGIIQLVAATLHALDEMQSSSWDAFSSAEKILKVNAGDTSQSLAAQISDLINKSALVGSQGLRSDKTESSKGLLTLEDALLLTVVGYILAGENFPTSRSEGPFSWQEEHFMKDALLDAIMENPTASNLKFLRDLSEEIEASKRSSTEKNEGPPNEPETIDFDDEWGNWGDEDAGKDTDKEKVYGDMQLKLELRDRVDNLFKYLHKLSALKQNMYSRGELLGEYKFSDDPYSSKGMLYKLLTRLLNKHDVPGLEYHASAVGRLFKSGFGRFGLGQVKPSLADQNIIIVFVVGGINGVEVQELQEALAESSRPDVELIIGGTTLLTPNDMFDLLLGDYSYVKSV
ncbi:membrane trafficking regulatory protein [Lithospermum erythrorhizon]|uniref:Membrane trafficking regulatory protein n=1 Tax=Lithospermum erythrorhizon TaxID=34254 RepID=A0AAV3NNP4_LITER